MVSINSQISDFNEIDKLEMEIRIGRSWLLVISPEHLFRDCTGVYFYTNRQERVAVPVPFRSHTIHSHVLEAVNSCLYSFIYAISIWKCVYGY